MENRWPQQSGPWAVFVIGVAGCTGLWWGLPMITGSDQVGLLRMSSSSDGARSCGADMVLLPDYNVCVDRFSASPNAACIHQKVTSQQATNENIAVSRCGPQSEPDAIPWTQVAVHQADLLCARAGKRLLSAEEWYRAALGTPATTVCNVAGSGPRVNQASECVSGIGAYDMVGNVWEWVDAEVVDGWVDGQQLPAEGYVHSITRSGWPTVTASTSSTAFTADYMWSVASGTQAVMRGGFYGSETDGGVYSVHAGITPTFTSAATGFRCGYSLSR